MSTTTKTICPYCGVGCGVLITPQPDHGTYNVTGDPDHPANYGRLCSKGAALGQTIGNGERVLFPSIDGERVEWHEATQTIAQRIQHCIDTYGKDSVALYVSGQLLTEDYYIANKLVKGYFGTAHIDTNSRLCMASTVVGHKRAFGSDTVPCQYEDLEKTDLIVLVGSNAAWTHPVLFQRILAARQKRPELKLVVIDPRATVSSDAADLHLALKPGSDVLLFNGLFKYLSENQFANLPFIENCTEGLDALLEIIQDTDHDLKTVAKLADVDQHDLTRFYQIFAETEKVITVFSQGVNQSSAGTDKVNAIINCHLYSGRIGRPGMGPFSFTGQTNAMGGREVGGLANQLAAHMELGNPDHQALVQEYWKSPSIATEMGYKAVELFDRAYKGEIKFLWIMCTNPVVSMPEADKVIAALKNCDTVVVSESYESADTLAYADIVLPAKTWGEKSGTVTNSERCISRQRPFLQAPGEAKADWLMLQEVAQAMGFHEGFSFRTEAEIFREYCGLTAYKNDGQRDLDLSGLQDISNQSYEEMQAVYWPVNGKGKQRMFNDGRFFTPSKKARFIATQYKPSEKIASTQFPLLLNTGRSRDQWHTMTRTALASRLNGHSPEPTADINPIDAMNYGIEHNSLCKIKNNQGEIIVRAKLSNKQRAGEVFCSIHWNDHFTVNARVDKLIDSTVDPFSGQPEFKITPVKIKPYNCNWYGFILSRRQLPLQELDYWCKTRGDGFYRYEFAGNHVNTYWPDWARSLLCSSQDDVNWVELHDQKTGHYRGARLLGDTIESCIYIARKHDLPPREWLASLFSKNAISADDRRSLLMAAPASGEDRGKTICACFGVGKKTIIQAIEQQKLTSVEEIGTCLKAGTNCGSCISELKEILADVHIASSSQ